MLQPGGLGPREVKPLAPAELPTTAEGSEHKRAIVARRQPSLRWIMGVLKLLHAYELL